MVKIGYIILGLLCSSAFAIGLWAGRGILFVDQVQLLRELREVSTIIFGIMGAWSAIVYPEELKRKLMATEATALDPETLERFQKLMHCIVLSAGIVAIILVMQFGAAILGQFHWVQHHCIYFRAISFAIGCVLAVSQIWVVFLMLVPINAADADVRAVQETQEHLKGGPQGKKGKIKP
jgi:hypothetical protein